MLMNCKIITTNSKTCILYGKKEVNNWGAREEYCRTNAPIGNACMNDAILHRINYWCATSANRDSVQPVEI